MKSRTEYLTFNLPARMEFLNIEPLVEEVVRQSEVREGLCLINTKQIEVIECYEAIASAF